MEQFQNRQMKYYENNKEIISEKQKIYYNRNREIRIEKAKSVMSVTKIK